MEPPLSSLKWFPPPKPLVGKEFEVQHLLLANIIVLRNVSGVMTDGDEDGYPTNDLDSIDDIFLPENDNQPIAYDATSESKRIHQTLCDELEEMESRSSADGDPILLTERQRTLLLEFFTVCSANIERLSATLLTTKLASDEHTQGHKAHEFFQNDINQAVREEILYFSGLIDEGIKGELARVRRRRNKLVHKQVYRRYISDVHGVKADVDRAIRSLEKLESIWDELKGQ